MDGNPVQNPHPMVLIVDDDPGFRFLVRQTLEKDGFIAEEAEDGAQAIGMFQELCPDIVLLDVVMPEMDGFDVCKTIRSMPHGLNVPIIMITSLKDIEAVNKSFQAGATDFLTKPVDWHLLSLRIQFLLRANHEVLQIVNKAIQGNAAAFHGFQPQEGGIPHEISSHIRHLEQTVGTQILHELLEIIDSAIKDVQQEQLQPSHGLRLVKKSIGDPVDDSKLLNMRLQEMQLNHSFVDHLLQGLEGDLSQWLEKVIFYFKERQYHLMMATLIQIKGVAVYLGGKHLSACCDAILTLPGQLMKEEGGVLLESMRIECEKVTDRLARERDITGEMEE